MTQFDSFNRLDTPEAFKRAQAFWLSVWDSLDSSLRQGWKTPWFAALPDAVIDGDGIFSAFSQAERRGVRIIQEPHSGHTVLEKWINWIGDGPQDPGATMELVIAGPVTVENVARMRSLIEAWLQRKPVTMAHAEFYSFGTEMPVRVISDAA
jgi:hypothetical protein